MTTFVSRRLWGPRDARHRRNVFPCVKGRGGEGRGTAAQHKCNFFRCRLYLCLTLTIDYDINRGLSVAERSKKKGHSQKIWSVFSCTTEGSRIVARCAVVVAYDISMDAKL